MNSRVFSPARIVALVTIALGVRRKRGELHPDAILAILMAMSLPDHVSLAEVKNRLSELVDRVERVHGRVVITKHGRPAAVIVSVEDLESLEATLDILSNPKLVDEIREAQKDIAKGRAKRLTKEEALKLTKRR